MFNFQNAFSLLQKIGKCMMLPVSVLPVAGILLGVGSANFSWLPESLSLIMAKSGDAIFGNLPLLFAIGIAIGLTDNDGVAALAGTVGWVVFLAAMGVCAKLQGIEVKPIMGIPSIETGVFGGIVVGMIAAAVVQPILPNTTAVLSRLLRGQTLRADHHRVRRHRRGRGAELRLAADRQGHRRLLELGRARPAGARLHDLRRRRARAHSLRPASHLECAVLFPGRRLSPIPTTGSVVHGEIARFISGDPTAGNMTGGYLFKMWGLPAAAHRHVARRASRAAREGRRHHDLRRAHRVPHRHHRADRVRVPLRRADALRHPRAARRPRVFRLHRARHQTRLHLLARAHRLRRALPEIARRAVAARPRADLGRGLLRRVLVRDSPLQPAHAGTRGRIRIGEGSRGPRAAISSRCNSSAPSADARTSSASTPASRDCA